MKTFPFLAMILGAWLATGCDTSGSARTSATAEPSATGSVPPYAAPKIVATEKVFAFGKVKLGTTVEHTFKLRNEGSAPLLIQRAKGS